MTAAELAAGWASPDVPHGFGFWFILWSLLHVPVPEAGATVALCACGAVAFCIDTDVATENQLFDFLIRFALVTVHHRTHVGAVPEVRAIACGGVTINIGPVIEVRRDMDTAGKAGVNRENIQAGAGRPCIARGHVFELLLGVADLLLNEGHHGLEASGKAHAGW